MRIVTSLLVMALVMALPLPAALAAGFDGKWQAEIPPQGKCNYTSTMTMMVMDGTIAAQIHNPRNVVAVTGTVDKDGSGALHWQGGDQGTIRFSNDRFDASWTNSACSRHAEGDRAPTDDQIKQIAEQRKQYQKAFDDLVARANQGDQDVDYTALRAAYPYTEQWDPYGSKIGELLNEAKAAKTGGDCPTALEKLDTIIKYNFTLDAAHALRADCLEDNDRTKSRIENDIADGLVHSLMNSGDGDSEKTAYVVTSLPEEMDVLANNHIQLKTRQTEIRGSDGRFYDEVQGLSLRNGAIRARTVYFDVSSFVAGRLSRAAMVTVAAATLH